MSDAAIASLVTGLVTVTTMVVGFLTLWIKLKYGVDETEKLSRSAQRVEDKLDNNTEITREGNATSAGINDKLNGGLEVSISGAMVPINECLEDHNRRITNLEIQMASVKQSVESVSKNVDSTRHEMRGHFQTITNMLTAAATIKATEKA